jgi:hypothetical protein
MYSILLFLVRYILVALSLGILFIKAKVFQRLKVWSRFALGTAMTIIILPFVTFLCALVWTGIPRTILFITPMMLAICFMIHRNNYKVLLLLINELANYFSGFKYSERKRQANDILLKCVVIFCTFIYFVFGMQIFNTSLHVGVNGADEAHYLIQGKIFYEDTNSREIDRYKGKYEGTVFTDDHGPLWPVYLADAVLLEDSFDANAMEIKIYCLFTVISMTVMIVNVGYIVAGSIWGGIFAIFLYFLYHYAIYFPIYGSRDGFRMVGLLGFFVLLFEIAIRVWNERNITLHECGFMTLFSYFALNGHQGNLFGMFGITMIFLILELFFRLPFKQIVLSGISILTGTLLCFYKNIVRYVERGRFNASELEAYSDTAAAKFFLEDYCKRFEWKTIINSYDKSDIFLVFIGLIAIIYYIVKSLKYYKNMNKSERNREEICAFCFFLGLLLPLTGIFNLLGYNVLQMFLGQLRYRMYFFVILALIGGMMWSSICSVNKPVLLWGSCIFIIPVFWMGLMNLNEYYLRTPNEYKQNQIDLLKHIAEVADLYATDGDVFVGAEYMQVYFDEPPKLLYDYYARPILTAHDNNEIEIALDELNAQVFIFYACDYLHYDVLPFYHYLQTDEGVVHKQYEEYGVKVDVYIVSKKER